MSWILFSILAALVWAVVSTVDKYILTKWIRKPIVPVMVLGVIGLTASFAVYLIKGFAALSYFNLFLAFIAGIFYILVILFYFKAVKIEEISRVVPLFYLSPIFVLILAMIFLKEIFAPIKYLGILMLIIGAVLISSRNFFKISFGKAFWFMIFSSFALAVHSVIIKYLLNFADFWTIFSYIRIGTFIALIPIFYLNFKDIKYTVKEHGKKVIGVISINEIINLFGVLFITIAMVSGFVTLVSALSSVQPFFVLFFALALSIFYPKILKEEIGKSVVFWKLIAIIIMVIGAVLII
ncbi:DMT family transporter [Candidatus Woesearchaeota archaeon]|nr:DMT family transporter [Candidatus Woesearchaeota archaeon]